jgi:hypothetical protein
VLQSVRSFSDTSSSSSSNSVGRLVVSSGEGFAVILETVGADAKVALSTPPSQLSRVVFEDESTLAVAKLLSNVLMLPPEGGPVLADIPLAPVLAEIPLVAIDSIENPPDVASVKAETLLD